MTPEEALVQLLNSDAGVSAQVSSRIYPLVIPQKTTLPAMAYQQLSLAPVYSHDGYSNLATIRFQLTIEAETHARARAVALAIRKRLRAYRGVVNGLTVKTRVDNEQDGYSDVGPSPVVRIDVLMQHDGD